jgi:hypothetical protein
MSIQNEHPELFKSEGETMPCDNCWRLQEMLTKVQQYHQQLKDINYDLQEMFDERYKSSARKYGLGK